MLQCLFFNKHNSFHAVLIFPLTLRKLIQRHFCSTRNIKSTQHTALNLTARQFNETPKLNCYNWKRNCGMKLPQCFSFRATREKPPVVFTLGDEEYEQEEYIETDNSMVGLIKTRVSSLLEPEGNVSKWLSGFNKSDKSDIT